MVLLDAKAVRLDEAQADDGGVPRHARAGCPWPGAGTSADTAPRPRPSARPADELSADAFLEMVGDIDVHGDKDGEESPAVLNGGEGELSDQACLDMLASRDAMLSPGDEHSPSAARSIAQAESLSEDVVGYKTDDIEMADGSPLPEGEGSAGSAGPGMANDKGVWAARAKVCSHPRGDGHPASLALRLAAGMTLMALSETFNVMVRLQFMMRDRMDALAVGAFGVRLHPCTSRIATSTRRLEPN